MFHDQFGPISRHVKGVAPSQASHKGPNIPVWDTCAVEISAMSCGKSCRSCSAEPEPQMSELHPISHEVTPRIITRLSESPETSAASEGCRLDDKKDFYYL